ASFPSARWYTQAEPPATLRTTATTVSVVFFICVSSGRCCPHRVVRARRAVARRHVFNGTRAIRIARPVIPSVARDLQSRSFHAPPLLQPPPAEPGLPAA